MSTVKTGAMIVAGAALLALAVAGCGVRGPLDPPPVAKAEGTATSGAATDAGDNSAAGPKPHRGFILDPMLR